MRVLRYPRSPDETPGRLESRLVRTALAIVLLACASACGGGPASAPAGRRGAEVYSAQGCGTCHAPDGAGTMLGPSLRGKSSHWTREKMVEYLRNPQAFAEKDPRLAEQARRYALPMTRFDKLTAEEIDAVAEHVLSLP